MKRKEIENRLRAAGIAEAAAESRILIRYATGTPEALILADPARDYEGEKLESALLRRLSREPLQYILGEWDFFGDTYRLTKDVLIPRPETECLVEKALTLLSPGDRVLDLCTGSGCIAVALARHADVTVRAEELSVPALEVAKENAERLGVSSRVSFFRRDVREKPDDDGLYDLITANPPYVSAREMEDVERELSYEPSFALTDGGDGLSLIGAILKNDAPRLSENGYLLLEHGASQGPAVVSLGEEVSLTGRTEKDLSGRDRFTVFQKNHLQRT
ncbi:MAG: peptide chain release factor N(5)-glutamine methyltransferase [Clostridia bacterium]|nr:peptide chain release factor N(5)-glutamine methyltransferase [Clostridia bacterium]